MHESPATEAPSPSRPRRVRLRHVLLGAASLGLWLVATEPWGMRAYQLLLFTAPGALLGLGASWMAYASIPHLYNWRIARNGAIAGALLLPPVLAFLVALDGNARPQRLLSGFIRAAWLALLGGMALASARSLRGRELSEAERFARHSSRRKRVGAMWRAFSRRVLRSGELTDSVRFDEDARGSRNVSGRARPTEHPGCYPGAVHQHQELISQNVRLPQPR